MIAASRASAAALATEPGVARAPRALVAIETPPAVDLGALAWLEREINQTLGQAVESLAAFAKPERDAATLAKARTHLHQVAGALRMVGLEALAEFTEEIGRVCGALEHAAPERIEASCAFLERACRKVSNFLCELAGGASPTGLKLFPEYAAMRRGRGAEAASPSDLFYPELRVRAPNIALHEAVAAEKLPSHLAKKRRQYQSGLLLWLRGEAAGARMMREAAAGIEAAATSQNLGSFWWTVRALAEAMAENGLEASPELKQLAGRIDLQIRRVVEGSAVAADRLRREVLYHVAKSAPVGPTVRAVQRAFRLASLIPPADAIEVDFAGTEPRLREAREQLAGIKETWLNFASGRSENIARLKAALTVVHTKATELRNGTLTELTAALLERLNAMPGGPLAESLAMEFTTGLILAETAFEQYMHLPEEFPQHVAVMLARLDAAAAGRPAPGDATALGSIGKRAQERVLLAQLGHEIRANLHHMEEVLDEFFRDDAKRPALASLVKDSRQIHGALRILGLDGADRLLALCDQRIQAFAAPEARAADEELDLLAESLCGLEFYFEAIEQQRPDAERVIAPLLARWLGEPLPEAVEEDRSVESAVAALRAELPRLLGQYSASDPAAREDLARKLSALADDAELIGDEELARHAHRALAALERDGNLSAAIDAIAGAATPAPQVSEETQRLLEVDPKGRDAGLLDIYLKEATTVLEAIAKGHDALTRDPRDREALAGSRRAFHTLKESARMVALSELGDLAGEVEAIHDRLLDNGRAASATTLAMIETSRAAFAEWLGVLRDTGRVSPDSTTLRAAIAAVEGELKPEPAAREAAPSTPAPIKNIWSVALVQPTSSETLASIHDEIDAELLARFLDEAAKLLTAARAELDAWRSAPDDKDVAARLRRTLHTFKGGARLAGAMRLGHLAQSMETRLLACEQRAAATPELFEALGKDLELIADALDMLERAEAIVALPRPGSTVSRDAPPAIGSEEKPAAAPVLSAVEQAAPIEAPQLPVAQAPIVVSTEPPVFETVRELERSLLDLTETVTGLSIQARELEARADAEMRVRMTELAACAGENGSVDLDGLARVQDLAHSLVEALNTLAGIRQSLRASLDPADPAPPDADPRGHT